MDSFLNSIFSINFCQFVANEGDTVEPGTKIAVILKSGEGVSHVGPSEKAVPQPSSPVETIDKNQPSKVETTPVTEKPKAPSPLSPKPSAQEPQLPTKERERRVSLPRCLIFILLYFFFALLKCYCPYGFASII